jgi:hypothetical protein
MKSRINFYLFIGALVVLDGVLLRSPNLLGKIGLIIYKYHYLRTFPKALLTVSLVVAGAIALAEGVRFIVKREILKRITGKVILVFFMLVVAGILAKTAIDFTAWSYSHTGLRFRIGAHLLPVILMLVFIYAFITLPKTSLLFPASPANEEEPNKTIIS